MTFSKQKIFIAVQLSALIYESDSPDYSFPDYLSDEYGNKLQLTSGGGTIDCPGPFLILSDEKDLYVVFKGTTTFEDWLTNIDIRLKKSEWFMGEGRVHAGFLEAFLNMREYLHEQIRVVCENTGDKTRIIACGHSLGGALAQVFCADLINGGGGSDYAEISCITFGSPRVGDKVFANFLETGLGSENIFRFVGSNDLATKVPWGWGKYQHTKSPYYFDRNGVLSRKVKFMSLLWNQLVDRLWNLRFLSGIENHNIDNYCFLVEGYLEKKADV